MSEPSLSSIARALGRIPTGLYIVSTLDGERSLGLVCSLMTQVGFDPPTVCLAVGRDRNHLAAIQASGRFAVSILDEASSGLMGAFFKPAPEQGSVFDDLEHVETPGGCPVLTGALAWLDCSCCGEFDAGDHVVVFGRVEAAELLRDGDSAVRLRKNGLDY